MNGTTTLQATDLSPRAYPEGNGLRRHRWSALGTTCEIQFSCENNEAAALFLRAAVEWVANFETRYSRFRPDSLLSQINAAAGKSWVKIDAEMGDMLDVCGSLHAMTRGILDATALPVMRLWDYRAPVPRIPTEQEVAAARAVVGWHLVQRRPGEVFLPKAGMALDFGGWGKEFAVDAVAQIARDHGITSALVDFGHDMAALGTPPGKPAWHIGLEDPTRPGSYRGSVGVRDRGVASSGDYLRSFTIGGRRYGHIVDPRTGRPVSNGCLQTTVIAPSCLQAGVFSTVAFILGPAEGITLAQQSPGVDAVVLTDRTRHQTRSFFQYVVES